MEKIAIIILNWNGLDLTRECIRSILASTHRDCDIYVLDNGSTENEALYLEAEFRDAVFVHRSEINLGFAGGNNYVVNNLLPPKQYAYYLLLNQDTHIDPACIENLLGYMNEHPEVAVSGPLVLEPDQKTVQSFGADIDLGTGKIISRYKLRSIVEIPDAPESVDCIIGNCFMVRSEVVHDIGLFDEKYFAYYEEADWCIRARAKGFYCAVVPEAKIMHSKAGGFRTYLNVRNMIWFEKKFANKFQFMHFIVYFWFGFVPERIKKGSPIKEIFKGALHGWFEMHKGLFN